MGRSKDPELLAKADLFLAKYAGQERKNIETAALEVRPDLKPESARVWGSRVLNDPESRKKLHMIEQGAIAKIYDLVDEAIDRLSELVADRTTPKAVQVKIIDLILKRVLGGMPDTVILAKFSMFDGEESKSTLREQIRQKLLEATYERSADNLSIRAREPEAPKTPSV